MFDKITKHPHKLLFDSLNLIKRAFLVQKFYAYRYKRHSSPFAATIGIIWDL